MLSLVVDQSLKELLPHGSNYRQILWVSDKIIHLFRVILYIVELFRIPNAMVLNELVVVGSQCKGCGSAGKIKLPVVLVQKLFPPV